MSSWASRTSELHHELAAIAELDARWWLVAGGAAAAETLRARGSYLFSDAEPITDTFIGHLAPSPTDPIREAVARAHAARAALRELDGELPEQPLAVTIERAPCARTTRSELEVAAFAIGDRVVLARLARDVADEAPLIARLAGPEPVSRPAASPPPFVCVSIGDDPLAIARHGHRRAWTDAGGPWLGLGRTGELQTVSTCHLVVDGYGHVWVTARMAEHAARLYPRTPPGPAVTVPPLAPVASAIPLGIAWRALPQPAPRALPLGYALGRVLHRRAGRPDARFSPTFQIPVAPGPSDDPLRRRRRIVHSAISVRFTDGIAEPFEDFEARARGQLAREAQGRGLVARLTTAARAMPVSLGWKRRSLAASRPRWLDRIAEVLGGRACLSRIHLDTPALAACAVSSPARLASRSDPLGASVVTVIDDREHAAITICGSGATGTHAGARALLDELLALV